MASRKRLRDEERDDDQPSAEGSAPEVKKTKIDHDPVIGETSVFNDSEEFILTIKLASTSKAKLNNPKLTLAQREVYRKHLAKLSQEDPDTDDHHLLAYEEAAKHIPVDNPASPDHQASASTSSDDLSSARVTNPSMTEPSAVERISEGGQTALFQTNDTTTEPEAERSTHEEESESEEDCDYDEEAFDDEGGFDETDEDRSEYDVDLDFKLLEKIAIEVTSSLALDDRGGALTVGYCNAKLIRRNQMRSEFYEEMEQPSDETARLAFDLFDRYGRVRSEFFTHPIIKGNGVWGPELSHGDILLIEELFVMQLYRRRGLGKKMMDAILALAEQKTWAFFAFLQPAMLNVGDIRLELGTLQDEAAKKRMEQRENHRAVSFYRSLGFRRVGSSKWFAMTLDGEHASRKLASSDDFDPPERPRSTLHPLLQLFQQTSDPTPSNSRLIFDQLPEIRPEPEFLSVLHSCNDEKGLEDACWMSKDKHGNTILHLAAIKFEVTCVEWIMSKPFGAQLIQSRNYRGETPTESLEFKLEELRTLKTINTVTESVSDQFRGHDERAIRCLIMLKQLDPLDSASLQRMVGGCTCGECLERFLSPRMAAALQMQASYLNDVLDDWIPVMKGPEWVDFNSDSFVYLPARVRNNLKTNKSMRQGFTNLFQYVATCLEDGFVPRVRNVLNVWENTSEWPPSTRNYLSRGGTVEPVVLAVFKLAMDEDEWTGDGEYQNVFGKDTEHLPECRNDREFGYVSGSCGYRRIEARRQVDVMGNTLDEDGNVIDSLA